MYTDSAERPQEIAQARVILTIFERPQETAQARVILTILWFAHNCRRTIVADLGVLIKNKAR